jgi:hypothetical protein
MGRRRGLFLGLAAVLVIGCATGQPVKSTALLERLRPLCGLTGPDVIQMDVALVEAPPGDRYLSQELWAMADDQVVCLDRKAVLEDNGFRVGQVGGIPPAGLQERLTSERTCINPQHIQMHAGQATPVPIGPPRARCEFRLRQDGGEVPVKLDAAQCVLTVTPTLTSDGRTRLVFTPQIQTGQKAQFYRPAPDLSGWMYGDQQSAERYPGLSWEVTLDPNEYVIVGPCWDRPDTLGHQCFIRLDEPAPRQRLLVIRTGRTVPGVAAETAPDEVEQTPPSDRSPPLACQAAQPTARGSAP